MDVLAKIRRHSAVPVIVCSGRDSEDDRIRTLNLGADDFVVKPFSFAELEARVRAVLRRGNGEPAATCLHHGELVVDRDTRTVTVRDKSVPMTRKEFDLLAFLAASPGPGVLPRGSSRAGLGLDRGMAGPLHGDRARAPGPSQDRARPGFSPLDHHRPRRRLPVHSARRLKRRTRERGPACAGRRPIAFALRAPNFWSKSPMEPDPSSADTEDTARHPAVVSSEVWVAPERTTNRSARGAGRTRGARDMVGTRASARSTSRHRRALWAPRPSQDVVGTGRCRMTFPLDVSEQGAPYGESLRTVDTNPTSVFTPVGQVMTERTILVAEDDTNTRRALQHYLKRSGYEVTEAASVDESLEAVFAQPADLVILDFDIGGGTADVLTSIRRRSSVPVIVCSGRSSERDRVALLNLGADDVLAKPYSFAELEARMRAVLRRGSRHAHDDARPRRPRHRPGHPQGDGRRRRSGHDPQGVRPPRLPRLRTGTGVLARGPARAGLGIQRTVAGPVHGHRAHPPCPPQDRGRPGESALDHHHPRHRVQIRRAGRPDHSRRRDGGAPSPRSRRQRRRAVAAHAYAGR